MGDTQVRARLIGVAASSHPAVDDVLLTQGTDLDPADLPSAVVESHFAKTWRVRPGDWIQPYVGGRPTPLHVRGIAASPEYLIVSSSRQDVVPSARTFAVLLVPLKWLQGVYAAGDNVNNIAVLFDPGANGAAVAEKVRSVLEPYGVVAPCRDRPGTGSGRIGRLMISENLLLWLVALVPGLILGTLTARGMGAELQTDLFSLSIFISPWTYLITSAGILATMMLALLPAIRRVNRLNLATATKVLT